MSYSLKINLFIIAKFCCLLYSLHFSSCIFYILFMRAFQHFYGNVFSPFSSKILQFRNAFYNIFRMAKNLSEIRSAFFFFTKVAFSKRTRTNSNNNSNTNSNNCREKRVYCTQKQKNVYCKLQQLLPKRINKTPQQSKKKEQKRSDLSPRQQLLASALQGGSSFSEGSGFRAARDTFLPL